LLLDRLQNVVGGENFGSQLCTAAKDCIAKSMEEGSLDIIIFPEYSTWDFYMSRAGGRFLPISLPIHSNGTRQSDPMAMVPLGDSGYPFGPTIIANPEREDRLFALTGAFEAVLSPRLGLDGACRCREGPKERNAM
jgi:hypothetical protein